MMRGFADIFGPTAASSLSSADIAAFVHLSSTSMAFSHSMTIVTAGSFAEFFGDDLRAGAFRAGDFAFAMGAYIRSRPSHCQPEALNDETGPLEPRPHGGS